MYSLTIKIIIHEIRNIPNAKHRFKIFAEYKFRQSQRLASSEFSKLKIPILFRILAQQKFRELQRLVYSRNYRNSICRFCFAFSLNKIVENLEISLHPEKPMAPCREISSYIARPGIKCLIRDVLIVRDLRRVFKGAVPHKSKYYGK